MVLVVELYVDVFYCCCFVCLSGTVCALHSDLYLVIILEHTEFINKDFSGSKDNVQVKPPMTTSLN